MRRYAVYKDAVYRDGGLVLWSCTVEGTDYAILLRGTTMDRHEGGISIVLLAGPACLNEMSYAWVDSALSNGGGGIVPFITRNQSIRSDAARLQHFRNHFPQQSPPYFCLAVMRGIALAHGCSEIAAIKHDRQIAYEPQYASSFRQSYSELWRSFGALDTSAIAYLLPVPPAIRPLEQIGAKHRKRAATRREHWSTITESARASIQCHIAN